jgi:ABC-type multidrug transport system ATPase subunit
MAAIETTGLTEQYSNMTAANYPDFSVGKGEVFGVLKFRMSECR